MTTTADHDLVVGVGWTSAPNATRLYKIVSTVRRDDVHVFTKMTDLCTILTYKDVPRPNIHIGGRVCI